MRIITWNINSVRLRLPLLLKLMEQENPDIICLQETKTLDEYFPAEAIKNSGYKYLHYHGMKSYNGVAIISREKFTLPQIHHRVGREDCRHICVKFPKFELHNLYIPAGGDIADRKVNEKFGHKLDFIDEITGWFANNYTPETPLISVGDFNIAPYENDVWSHKQLLKVVSHTPIEVEKLNNMKKSLDWIDTSRHFIPEEEKCYTWWSYRNRDWKKSNRGRRLDHIWATPALRDRLRGHKILESARDWEKPSDHVPLIVDFDI